MLSTASVQKLVRYGQLGLLGVSNAASSTSGTSDAAANTNVLNYAAFVKRSYTETSKKVADTTNDVSVNVAVLTSGELWSSALDSIKAASSTSGVLGGSHVRAVPDGLIAAAVFTTAMCAHERSLPSVSSATLANTESLLSSVTAVVSLLNRSNTSESLLLAQCFATLVFIAAEMCLLEVGVDETSPRSEPVAARLLVVAANQFQRMSGSFLLPKVFAPRLAGQQLRGLLRQQPAGTTPTTTTSPYQHWSLTQRLAVLSGCNAISPATKVAIHDLVTPYLGTQTSRYFVYLRGGEAGSGGGGGGGKGSNASAGAGNGPLVGRGGLGSGDERMALAGCKDVQVQSAPLAFVCTPPVDPDVLGEVLFLSKVVLEAGNAGTQSVSITSNKLSADAIRRAFAPHTAKSSIAKISEAVELVRSWAASMGIVFDSFCDCPAWSLFAVEQRRKTVAKRLKEQEKQGKKALKEQEREVQRKIKARAMEALVQARAEEAKAKEDLRSKPKGAASEAGSDDDKMSVGGVSNATSGASAAPSWAFSAGGMSRAESDVRSMMSAASFASYSTFLSVVDSEALDREHREQHESADGNSNLPLILMEMGSFSLYQCIEAVREEKLLVPYFEQVLTKDMQAALTAYTELLEKMYSSLWAAVTDLFASAARRMRVGVTSGSSGAQVPFFSLADDVQYNYGLGYQSLGLIFARLIVPSLLSEATEDRLTAPPPFMGSVAARARRARITLSSAGSVASPFAIDFRRQLQRTEAAHMAHALTVYETVAPQVINQNIGAVFTVCCRVAEDETCEQSTRSSFAQLMQTIVNRLGQANQLQLLIRAIVDGVSGRSDGKKGDDEDDEDDEDAPNPEKGDVVAAHDRSLNSTLSALTTLQQTAISTSEDTLTLLSSAAFRQSFAAAVSETLDSEAILAAVMTQFQHAITADESGSGVTSLIVTLHVMSVVLQGLNPSTFASFPVFEKLIELEVAVSHELLASIVAPALFGTLADDGVGFKSAILATPKKTLRGVFVLGCETLIRVRGAMLRCMEDLAVESLKDVLSMINETVWRLGAGTAPTLVGTAPADDAESDSSVAVLTTDNIVGCASKSTVVPLTNIHFTTVLRKLAAQRLHIFDSIAVIEGTPEAPDTHRSQYAAFIAEQNELRSANKALLVGEARHFGEVYTLRVTAEEERCLARSALVVGSVAASDAAVSSTTFVDASKRLLTDFAAGSVALLNYLEGASTAAVVAALSAMEPASGLSVSRLVAAIVKALSCASTNAVASHILTKIYNLATSVPIQNADESKTCLGHAVVREVLDVMINAPDDVRSKVFLAVLLGSTNPTAPKPASYLLPRHAQRFADHTLLAATTKLFKGLMKYAVAAYHTGDRSAHHLTLARTFAVLATQFVPVVYERETVATMVAKAVVKVRRACGDVELDFSGLTPEELAGDIVILVALDTCSAAAKLPEGSEPIDYAVPAQRLTSLLQAQLTAAPSTTTFEAIFECSPQLLAGHAKHAGVVYTSVYGLVSSTMYASIAKSGVSSAVRALLHLRTVPTVAFSNLYPAVLAALSTVTHGLTASSNSARLVDVIRSHRDEVLELCCYPLASFFTGALGGALFTAVVGTFEALIQAAAQLLTSQSISVGEHAAIVNKVISATNYIIAHHPAVVFGTRSATLPNLMRLLFQGVLHGLEVEGTQTATANKASSEGASTLVPFNTLLARCTGTHAGATAGASTSNFDDAVASSVYTCNAGTGPRAMVCAAIASAILASVNKTAQLVLFSSHSEFFDQLGKELLIAMGRARLPRASMARAVYVSSQMPERKTPIANGGKRDRQDEAERDHDASSDDEDKNEAGNGKPAPQAYKRRLPLIKSRRRVEPAKLAANSLTARTTYASLCYAAIGNSDGQQLLHQLSLRVNDESGRSIFQVSK